jgi:hypothetical protein
MSDWWSKKLAGEKPSTPRVSPTPPTQPVIRLPATQQTVPQEQQRQEVLNPNRAPTENISMGEAIRLWKGGEAHRRDGGLTCPDCGSNNVFSRTGRGANSMVNGAQPAPRCFECGWNGLYDQASQASWNS